MKPLKPIEYDKDGNPVLNLSASQANDDWLRSVRLLKEGKTDEFEELDSQGMSEDEDQENS